mmetsp:Transcript_11034/g.22602  ORF Transcript_11034/g.22602 Transcript_11034/m.22602 type:complete len:80 (-) Transcript_11034:147-386(-)
MFLPLNFDRFCRLFHRLITAKRSTNNGSAPVPLCVVPNNTMIAQQGIFRFAWMLHIRAATIARKHIIQNYFEDYCSSPW